MRFIAPLSLLVLSACTIHIGSDDFREETEELRFEESPEILRVTGDAVSIQLVGSDAEGVDLTIVHRWKENSRPTVDTQLEDGVLLVETDCPGPGSCNVELQMELPASTAVDIDISAGSLTAQGLDGSLYFETSAGSAELDSLSGDIEIHTQAGSVDAIDLSSTTALFDACSGSVSAEFLVAPDVDAEVCTGSIELRVPEGDYRLDLSTTVGSVSAEGVNDDDQAAHGLRAHTQTGSIDVIGN